MKICINVTGRCITDKCIFCHWLMVKILDENYKLLFVLMSQIDASFVADLVKILHENNKLLFVLLSLIDAFEINDLIKILDKNYKLLIIICFNVTDKWVGNNLEWKQ